MRTNGWRVSALGLAIGLALTVAGCGDDANDRDAGAQGDQRAEAGPPRHADNDLSIAFAPMYSAFIDEGHPCRVPAIVLGAVDDVQWRASDDSMVELDPGANGGVLITTKKAGTVDIIATSGPLSGKATLEITRFSAEEWGAGNRRYNSAIRYVPPTMAEVMAMIEQAQIEAGDGGVDFPAVFRMLQPPDGTACTSCHGDDSASLSIEYTPQQTAGYSDSTLAEMIRTGIRPAPSMASRLPSQVLQMLHPKPGDLDATQTRNLVAYMRTLPPKSRGPIDFGAGLN